ncbi:uncharacterized protein LOC130892869 isoform X1 [Diorhabda carinulata]|uniref:uncharacterized protein LOC130892869 isoform X1 n=2 Tax=Diorhabda carinulata TaxID=1163345 RepID=UPI0025A13F25|nr:uncharacterized protein LOC130892869 isoform X1 [Diorhabda carinulata]
MDNAAILKMDQFKRIQGGTLIIGDKYYSIFKGINTVGRNKVAVVNIKNLNVSQNQALIILIGETQHYISDLNSSNGTFLHNTKLIPFKLYELTNNAEIKFGDVDAVYKKILSPDTTINLQETLEVVEMTQNMTQNFYASNTQIIDNKNGNAHQHSIVKQSNTNPYNIHEIQTQIREYPSVLSKIQVEQSSQAVTEEKVNTDIHDAPTQIVSYSNTMSKESNSKNFPNYEHQEEYSERTSPNTQIITEEEKEAIVNKIKVENSRIPAEEVEQNIDKPIKTKTGVIHYSQEPSTSGLGTFLKEYDDSFLSESKKSETNLVVEESLVEKNSNDGSIDFLELDNTQSEFDLNHKSPTSPTDSESNESEDIVKHRVKPILKLPDTQIEIHSSFDDTQDIGFRKKSLKPIVEDSDTEDDTQEQITKLPLINGEKIVTSDSDTDCEDLLICKASAKIITRTHSVSDDDTDIENTKKCELDDTDCIPATQDAFANGLEHKPTKSSQLSTNHSSEESFKLGLTELMSFTQNDDENVESHKVSEINLGKVIEKEKEGNVIKSSSTCSNDPMPTQVEEMVKKFVFKKKSANLDDSLTTILSTNRNSNKNENTETESINENNKEKSNKTIDDVFLQPTQLDTLSAANQSLKANLNENENTRTKNNTENNGEQPNETIDNVFLQPTQLDTSSTTIECINTNLNDNENSEIGGIDKKNKEQTIVEVFRQPTQLNTSSITIESMNTNLNDNNENFKIGDIDKNNKEQKNQTIGDVFLQPTQLNTSSTTIECINKNLNKDEITKTENSIEINGDQPTETIDDVFFQPTQLETSLTNIGSINTNSNNNEIIKAGNSTKIIEEQPTAGIDVVLLQPNQLETSSTIIKSISANLNKHHSIQTETSIEHPTEAINDVYDQPTQSVNPKESENDIFLQPTQSLISEETDDDLFLKPKRIQKPTRVHDATEPENDIFLQPTQLISSKEAGVDISSKPSLIQCKTQKMDDDLFSQPTQLMGSTETRNLIPTDSCTQNELYLASTQVIQEKTDGKAKELSMTQEDLYGQETQKIEDIPDILPKTQSEKNVFMLPTQEMTDICPDSTETQLELHYLNETIPVPVDSDRPSNPLLRELNKEDSQEMFNENKSSVKEKGDKHKVSMLQFDKMNSSTETLSQIEAFLKKPLPPRKSARHLGSRDKLNVIKASVDKSILNNAKKPIKHEDRAETLSQIVAFINKSDTKQVHNKCANQSTEEVKISISGESFNNKAKSLKEHIDSKQFSNESLEDSDEEIEKKDSSREIRSDVDQSFALLQSKTSKIRRKPTNNPILEEIKVMVTSHRKSMSIAENDNPDLIIPLKKSKRTTSSSFTNLTEAKQAPKITKSRKSKVQSTTLNQTHPDNNPTISNTGKCDDITTTSKESLPENPKNKKLSTTDERKTTRCKKLTKDSKTDDPKVSRTRKSKLSFDNWDDKIVKNTDSITDTDKKRKKEPADSPIKSNSNPTNLINSINIQKSTEESSEDDVGINNIKRSRRKKRTIDSSEDTSDSPTPVKHTRTSRKISSIAPEDSNSNNSSETTPKKNRNTLKTDTLSSSVERSKRKLKPKVVFTMLDSPKLESYIRHLGGSIVDNVDSATVLMTQSVKRSQKLLTAVAQGKPICPPSWINESLKNNGFLDPWDYILVDEEAEKKWEFSLKESLIKADKGKLLAGYVFQLMTNTATEVLKGAIEASGGKCVTKLINKNHLDKFVIVASSDYKAKYNKIKKQHPEIMVIEPEAIFDGILRQELRFSRHLLS